MEFYIAQAISVVTCILAVLSMQFKSMRSILIGQILVNLTSASTYFFLGGFSGAGVCLLAIVQSVVMFMFNIKSIKPKWWYTAIFIAMYVACSVIYFESYVDIFSSLGAICFALSVAQTKPAMARFWYLFNPLCWLVFDLSTKAYINFGLRVVLFFSIIFAMLRNDFKKNKEV